MNGAGEAEICTVADIVSVAFLIRMQGARLRL